MRPKLGGMSDYDPADFVDEDFRAHKAPSSITAAAAAAAASRAPSREEVDSKVVEAQQKLTELKRMQEELERERASLEETRRRQAEFQTGRQEMVHSLTRGIGLLEEAEFTCRRDAEQMAKSLAEFRDALTKIEAIREETWTKDNFSVELTRALTAIENARMEWNGARLKFPVLSGQKEAAETAAPNPQGAPLTTDLSFIQLCKYGLALTWPLVTVALGIFIVVLLRR